MTENMLNDRHLNNLREKFNSLDDDELLTMVIDERYKYSTQAIGIADDIANQRGFEYEIPVIVEPKIEEVDFRLKWADRLFAVYFLLFVGWKIYFYIILYPNTFKASTLGVTISQGLALFLAYQICLKAKYIWLMLGLSFCVLILVLFTYSLFGWILVLITFLVNSYLSKPIKA
jgi:hypothetical protein